jgi:rubredoxin
VQIPDVANLSDEEMSELFPERDGVWSEKTKEIRRKLGDLAIDIDRGWAFTPQNWICPCCHRGKRDIARVTDSGFILCSLHSHHDHTVDYAKELFEEIEPQQDRPSAVGQMYRGQRKTKLIMADRRSMLLHLCQRFERTLICQDCNNADGVAKAKSPKSIDRRFSFKPSEIQMFISPSANRPHEVDVEMARAIYKEKKSEFQELLARIETLSSIIRTGGHKLECSRTDHTTSQNLGGKYMLRAAPKNSRQAISELNKSVLSRSVSRSGHGKPSRSHTVSEILAPSEHILKGFNDQMSKIDQVWRDAGHNWSCPCCERRKLDTVKHHRKHGWYAKLLPTWFFDIIDVDPGESDSIFDSSGADMPLSLESGEDEVCCGEPPWEIDETSLSAPLLGPFRIIICHDCRVLMVKSREWCGRLGEHCMTFSDLRMLVGDARPHQPHHFDAEAIDRIVTIRSRVLEDPTAAKQTFKRARDEYKRIITSTRGNIPTIEIKHMIAQFLQRREGLQEYDATFLAGKIISQQVRDMGVDQAEQ